MKGCLGVAVVVQVHEAAVVKNEERVLRAFVVVLAILAKLRAGEPPLAMFDDIGIWEV